jgi:hypothetical protein
MPEIGPEVPWHQDSRYYNMNDLKVLTWVKHKVIIIHGRIIHGRKKTQKSKNLKKLHTIKLCENIIKIMILGFWVCGLWFSLGP